ncbi:MAG: hypothetical protein J7M18_03460 [Candidatus Eremiobacteraeota bacterium]|nr:hypothetical protein [Candidatus Eremiobacteraeota bacterium]
MKIPKPGHAFRTMIVFLLMVVFIFIVHARASDDSLIVAGKRIGKIKLGDHFHPLEETWGKPNKVEKTVDGTLVGYYRHKMGFLVKQDFILTIYCENPYYKTKKGTGVGDKIYGIRVEFGKGKKIDKEDGSGYYLHYTDRGISFAVDSRGFIEQIMVY